MKNIKLLNKIAACGTGEFDPAAYTVGEDVAAPEAIMVRSAAMHDMEFGSELEAIARAGAGVNNMWRSLSKRAKANLPAVKSKEKHWVLSVWALLAVSLPTLLEKWV